MPTKSDPRPLASAATRLEALTVVVSAATLSRQSQLVEPLRVLGRWGNEIPRSGFELRTLSPMLPVEVRTIGRRTGQPHEVRVLATPDGLRFLVTSCLGYRADWVQNLLSEPVGEMLVGGVWRGVRARFLRGVEDRRAASAIVGRARTGLSRGILRWFLSSAAADSGSPVIEFTFSEDSQ